MQSSLAWWLGCVEPLGVRQQRSSSRLQADARPRLVALGIDTRLVHEYRFIRADTIGNGRHDISSARKATLAVPDGPVSLSRVGVKPLINEIEVVTAVIDLAVAVASKLPPSMITTDFRRRYRTPAKASAKCMVVFASWPTRAA